MARDIIDDRLLGALHLRVMDRAGFAHDPAVEHTAFQAGTLKALLGGQFDGDATVGEVLRHGDLGLGTIQGLDGELVIVDGQAFVIDAAGRVRLVPDETLTPFAVVSQFVPRVTAAVDRPHALAQLAGFLDELVDEPLEPQAASVSAPTTARAIRVEERRLLMAGISWVGLRETLPTRPAANDAARASFASRHIWLSAAAGAGQQYGLASTKAKSSPGATQVSWTIKPRS